MGGTRGAPQESGHRDHSLLDMDASGKQVGQLNQRSPQCFPEASGSLYCHMTEYLIGGTIKALLEDGHLDHPIHMSLGPMNKQVGSLTRDILLQSPEASGTSGLQP